MNLIRKLVRRAEEAIKNELPLSSALENGLNAAIRKWQRLAEELEGYMLKPNASLSTVGAPPTGMLSSSSALNNGEMNSLVRKRRANTALTVSDLYQRQRRRIEPNAKRTSPSHDAPTGVLHNESLTSISARSFHTNDILNDKLRYSLESGIIALLKKYALGIPLDSVLVDQLLHDEYENNHDGDDNINPSLDEASHSSPCIPITHGGRIGQLLIQHPLAISALMESLFTPGSSTGRLNSLELKLKCAKLLAVATLASERAVLASVNMHHLNGGDHNKILDQLSCGLDYGALANVG